MRLRRGEHGGFGFAVTSGVDQQGDGEDLVRVEDVVLGGLLMMTMVIMNFAQVERMVRTL